ncbi:MULTISPECIES: YggT family protein [unclassified Psychrobacillus]|uniref:YggT family protein n=1 Tax=unclassified Psychrobacillus TaxID=2636677 RepID=UPI00146D171B|nr:MULTISPECIES: YggT family protein [unclassified Psychrobacillus]MCM3357023.1 YggT family protein [Psychrobacillus sp. MER TA 171]NME05252.1 YggT family protein [Psychrobacillus sp. BL-248-WT-3]
MDLILFLLAQLVQIYSFALIIYIFMSWVPNVKESTVGQFLGRICEPYLEPFRKIIPPIGMIDISPIVAIFVLNIAMRGIISLGHYI